MIELQFITNEITRERRGGAVSLMDEKCERTHERYRTDGSVERWTTVENMPMSDCMDSAWEDFLDLHETTVAAMPKAELLLLKEAWLHGARAAMDQSIAVLRGTVPPSEEDYDPTPWCNACGPKSACTCGPRAEND